MRVVCESCGTTYKIPESKLVKEVNKATCRKCGFRMMIRRPSAVAADDNLGPSQASDEAATQVTANPLQAQENERAALDAETRIEPGAADDWSDESPTNVQDDPTAPPSAGSATPPAKAPKARTVANSNTRSADTDMILALFATFASAGGAMLLATNTGDVATQRMVGLGIALWGALTGLFLLVTGNLWRQQGNLGVSIALATVLSIGGSAFVEVALHDGEGLGSNGSSEARAPSTAMDTPQADSPPIAALAGDDAADGSPSAEDRSVTADAEKSGATSAPEDVAKASASTPARAPVKPASTAAPSGEREAPVADGADDEMDLEDPVEDFDDLGDPDFDAIAATPPPPKRDEARSSEDAANRRAAERDRRQREAERAAAAKERAKAKEQKESKDASGGSKMSTLPLTVVDTMIRSNMSVKRCFFNEKQATGEMPRRVNVRFTVLNTGRVSSARVTTDQYKGGTLDGCLGRAFKAIKFPAFEGEAKSMTYPFVL